MEKICYLTVLNLLLNKKPSEELIDSFMFGEDGSYDKLADFIGENLKDELHWMCCFTVIDFMEAGYVDARDNGNFK